MHRLILALALALVVGIAVAQSGTVIYVPIMERPADPTATPTTAPTATPSPTPAPALGGIKNPGFEDGHSAWLEVPGNTVILDTKPITPHTGLWLARIGGNQSLSQTVNVPNKATVYLNVWKRQRVSDNAEWWQIYLDNVFFFEEYADSSTDWVPLSFDMSGCRGKAVSLKFVSSGIYLYLDDISFSETPNGYQPTGVQRACG